MGPETEGKPSFGQKIRAHSGLFFRDGLKFITEIPFTIRAIRAPEGELIRGDEIIAKGRIVRYSGKTHVILTEDDMMVFPNKRAGDIIRPLPRK